MDVVPNCVMQSIDMIQEEHLALTSLIFCYSERMNYNNVWNIVDASVALAICKYRCTLTFPFRI